jgi:hypothetical protein
LADGDYLTTLPASSVTDADGHPLADDYAVPFFVLGGDADHDRDVDVNDLSTETQNRSIPD